MLQNNLKKYAFSMADGTGVTLEQLRVQRGIVPEQRKERWNRSEPSYLSDGVECFVLSEGINEGETAGEMRPVVQIVVMEELVSQTVWKGAQRDNSWKPQQSRNWKNGCRSLPNIGGKPGPM